MQHWADGEPERNHALPNAIRRRRASGPQGDDSAGPEERPLPRKALVDFNQRRGLLEENPAHLAIRSPKSRFERNPRRSP